MGKVIYFIVMICVVGMAICVGCVIACIILGGPWDLAALAIITLGALVYLCMRQNNDVKQQKDGGKDGQQD